MLGFEQISTLYLNSVSIVEFANDVKVQVTFVKSHFVCAFMLNYEIVQVLKDLLELIHWDF